VLLIICFHTEVRTGSQLATDINFLWHLEPKQNWSKCCYMLYRS